MKTTPISSQSISNAMQLTVTNAQTEITKLQTEAVTGTYADVGLELGTRTSTSLDYTRESARLQSIMDANSIAEQRMDASQLAMENMSASAQSLLNSVIALSGNNDASSLSVAKTTAMSTLENFVSYSNTAVNGEYLFSGINTDAQTLGDTFITDIADDFNAQFSAQFPDPSAVTADEMKTFLTDYQDSFDWPSWTGASETTMSSRISTSETVSTSTTANSDGFKSLVLAGVISSQLVNSGLSASALSVVNDTTTSLAGSAISGIDTQRSKIGLSQERVEKANTYMSSQKTIIDTQLTNLVGVDTYEASTRLTELMNQVETSYSITSKIQGLSLVNYL
ncbi:flagellar hook-associated family protein [Agrobacterium rosae]|uniref:Flagellin n=1 Tax=Agrobacterium rosae TaxID=1972867 RepID=A0A1R3TM92_9HYPH|nr:flagellar hook-associated family protein [Agrobacterium rosae]KAA3514040.1 flagellar hook-associated family protein [Agrobacterium rosae]KAA3522707.1 flagellar hook-associated family protein [Agrobacterium rosae]MBN7807323.1 flagellar hook-associated family protein [Agrobacterium rosae]MCM2434031.1 flagellar hook-associated family protein [Agrobacterium rosae]MDX8302866.1 flagellar hook-associated family protein [Agrobacterium rosae]